MSITPVNFIYTDKCSTLSKKRIMARLGLTVIIRDELLWDLRYIVKFLTDPALVLISLNNVDEKSIAEITMAAFMCKQILITTNVIKEYTNIYQFITDLEPGCNLELDNNTFIHWYTYTIRG